MNAGTKTAKSSPLSFVAANEVQTQNDGFPADFQDLCSFAMDRALGIEKVPLVTVVGVNSSVLDIYESSLWYIPVFGNLLEMASQAVACSVELQMNNWLTLLAPYALSAAARESTLATNSGREAELTADELAHSMDVAIGERFTALSSTVTSIAGGQSQPRADVLERSMDIAIGMRKAA